MALLVHLDGINRLVAAVIVILTNRLLEGLCKMPQPMAQHIWKAQNHRCIKAAIGQANHHFMQGYPLCTALQWVYK